MADSNNANTLADLKNKRVKELKKLAQSLGSQVPTNIKDKDTLVRFVHKLILENVETCIFKQLAIGKDIANPDRCTDPMQKMIWGFAKNMLNFNYIYGDIETKEVIVIDPAWDPMGMLKYCESKGWTVKGCILTHYHVDHAGGAPPPPFNAFGIQVPGAIEIAKAGIPVYIHASDVDKLVDATKISRDALTSVEDGAEITVGSKKIRCIHAPGHTRGSMVLVADDENFLISGDVIFPGSCGKLEEDWPESCQCMYNSLMKLGKVLKPQYCIYPGHAYSDSKTTVKKELESGLLKPCTWPEFAMKMGQDPSKVAAQPPDTTNANKDLDALD